MEFKHTCSCEETIRSVNQEGSIINQGSSISSLIQINMLAIENLPIQTHKDGYMLTPAIRSMCLNYGYIYLQSLYVTIPDKWSDMWPYKDIQYNTDQLDAGQ